MKHSKMMQSWPDYAAADDQQWSAQEYADYEHYAEASDYDFDSSIYDDYAMPQTSQAEQSHTGKEHTHEHEHEEGAMKSDGADRQAQAG